jgi:hypothetical protein
VNAWNTKKNINTANTARININFKYYTTDSRYQRALFSSNRRVRDIPAASHWCKKADLMTAISGEALTAVRRF